MKKLITLIIAGLLSGVSSLYAANGDLIVNGKVGIGTAASPEARLQINTPNLYDGRSLRIAASAEPAFYSLNLDSDVSNGLVRWHFGVANAGTWYPNNLTLDRGNVGIGTMSPSAPLDFGQAIGNKILLWPYSPTNSYGFGIQSSLLQMFAGTSADIAFGTGASTNFTELMRIKSSGNVGIGTTAPKGKFSVSFNNDDEIVFYSPGDNHLAIQTALDSQPLNTYGGTGEHRLLLQPIIGNVGIGINDPLYKLDVAGDVHANSFVPPSDRRFKDNIKSIESPLNKVLSMEGVTFNWKRDEFTEKNFPEGRHYGVIAQEIEKILPEIVLTASDGSKSVAYMEIIPVLIEAIKEQQKAIEHQQKEIEHLKKVLADKQ